MTKPESTQGVFHEPVMPDVVCELLSPCLAAGTVVDATVGGGGHTGHLLERLETRAGSKPGGSGGRLLGLDVDPEAVACAMSALGGPGREVTTADCRLRTADCRLRSERRPLVVLVQASYVEMGRVVDRLGLKPVTGVLFDFGVSLHQLRTPGRGFGHDVVGDADMRFQQSGSGMTARALIRRASERELAGWLWEYGNEPRSRRIAHRLWEERGRVQTTEDIARVVEGAVSGRQARRSLARVFLALRIAVNRELEAVERGLAAGLGVLARGGRLAAISYHSGEDRLVKRALRAGVESGRLRMITRKAVRPGLGEVRRNPRSRSARLRAAEVVS